MSDKNNLNLTEISYELALSLMHYSRFLNKVITLRPSEIFTKYLVIISGHLHKAKIYAKNLST